MSQDRTVKKDIRWGWIVAALITLTLILFFFLQKNEPSVLYYMTVSEYLTQPSKFEGKKIKLAGRVKKGSLKQAGEHHSFTVEESGKEIEVLYVGLVPDTFKEGSEVVVEGASALRTPFQAKTLMAKCASKYEEGGLPPLESFKKKYRGG